LVSYPNGESRFEEYLK